MELKQLCKENYCTLVFHQFCHVFLPVNSVLCFLLSFSYSCVLPVELLQDFGNIRSFHGLTGGQGHLVKEECAEYY